MLHQYRDLVLVKNTWQVPGGGTVCKVGDSIMELRGGPRHPPTPLQVPAYFNYGYM